LHFKKEDRRKIREIIKKDTKFLKDHSLMDYSLLFAVENDLSVKQNYSYSYINPLSTNSHNSSAGTSVYFGAAPGGGRPTNLMAAPF
jgi:CRISPR/Cas system-associated endonuclease Cas3-HD